jgi:hypothetical protein
MNITAAADFLSCQFDQSDRRKIRRWIVRRLFVERLILGEGAHAAERELVAVWGRLCDAGSPDHASRSANIFDNYLSAQQLRQTRRKNATDDIS